MSKKKFSEQLPLETGLFSIPDSTDPHKLTGRAKRPQTKKAAKAIPESQQPFLPGLSRRGRPRSANPVPPTIRASQSRRRRAEAGAKRIELVLDRAIADQLEALVEHFKVSRLEVISRLITQSAKRITPRK
jgi:hypothetical protein